MLKVATPLNQLDLAVVITSEIVAYQQRRRPPPTNEAAGSMTSTRCPSFGLTGTRTAAGDVSGSFPSGKLHVLVACWHATREIPLNG